MNHILGKAYCVDAEESSLRKRCLETPDQVDEEDGRVEWDMVDKEDKRADEENELAELDEEMGWDILV